MTKNEEQYKRSDPKQSSLNPCKLAAPPLSHKDERYSSRIEATPVVAKTADISAHVGTCTLPLKEVPVTLRMSGRCHASSQV